MLMDLIMAALVGLFEGIIGLFPAYTLPGSMQSFGSELGSAVAGLNGVFPVVPLGICLGLVLVAELFIGAWALVAYVYDKIPFKFS